MVKEGVKLTPSSLLITQAEPAVWSLEEPHCGNYPASTLRQHRSLLDRSTAGGGVSLPGLRLNMCRDAAYPLTPARSCLPLHTGQAAYAGRSD